MPRILRTLFSILLVLIANNVFAQKPKRLTSDQIGDVRQIICEWSPGKGAEVIPKLEKLGLKVLPGIRNVPYGVCPLTARMTDDLLRQIYEINEISAVYPNIKLPIKLDQDQLAVREVTAEDLEAFEFAGSMICEWVPGNLDSAKQEINAAGLKLLPGVSGVPYGVCTWKYPLKLSQITSLVDSKSFVSVAPNLRGMRENVTEGRIIEVSLGSFKTERDGNRTVAIPDDPDLRKLWGMFNCRANQAWVKARETKVIVAVIDSGVDYNHPDLQLNMWRNPEELRHGRNGIDDDGNGIVDDINGVDFMERDANQFFTVEPLDETNHGTHCAGTIGAVGGNTTGVVGVCWDVQIMPLRIFDDKTMPDVANLLFAIDYAVQKGATVANMSFHWEIVPGFDLVKPLIEKRIAAAAQKGMILVCAAGNARSDHDVNPQFPSGFELDNIVSVAAITEKEELASFSNFGAKSVDIAAPGEDIYSTIPGNKYASFNGTSMAAPHVAGAIALIRGTPEHGSKNYRDIISLVYRNARVIPSLKGKCVTGATLDIGFLNPSTQTPPTDPQVVVCPPRRCYCPPPCRPFRSFRFRCRGWR